MKDLISIRDLQKKDIELILDTTASIMQDLDAGKTFRLLEGKLLISAQR